MGNTGDDIQEIEEKHHVPDVREIIAEAKVPSDDEAREMAKHIEEKLDEWERTTITLPEAERLCRGGGDKR